jgi:hypothetical protein
MGIGGDCKIKNYGEVWRKETMNSGRWRHPLLDSSFQKVLGVEADLWSITEKLGTASSDGERTWPKLGFRWWFIEEERGEGEVEMGNLGFA